MKRNRNESHRQIARAVNPKPNKKQIKEFEETFGKRTLNSVGWNVSSDITIGEWLSQALSEAEQRGREEINKLAKFFMEDMPNEIKEGSAVDNAIRLLTKLKSQK